MKSYLISLFFMALAGAATAQPVEVVVMPSTAAPQAGGVVPVSTATAATAVMTVTAPSATGHLGRCENGKCSKHDTACVAAPDTITKTKVLFSSDCEVKCHKGIFNLFHRGGDCASCPDGKCGHAHVERYLYKRVETQTCDSYKCVPTPRGPECAPTCANGICVGSQVAAPTVLPVSASTTRP
jgi:hypothetical protein